MRLRALSFSYPVTPTFKGNKDNQVNGRPIITLNPGDAKTEAVGGFEYHAAVSSDREKVTLQLTTPDAKSFKFLNGLCVEGENTKQIPNYQHFKLVYSEAPHIVAPNTFWQDDRLPD